MTTDSTEIAQYLQGARTTGHGTRTQPVYNPATGKVSRQVRLGNQQDVDAAMNVNLFRQLIRAEHARQEFFTAGRLPVAKRSA